MHIWGNSIIKEPHLMVRITTLLDFPSIALSDVILMQLMQLRKIYLLFFNLYSIYPIKEIEGVNRV